MKKLLRSNKVSTEKIQEQFKQSALNKYVAAHNIKEVQLLDVLLQFSNKQQV